VAKRYSCLVSLASSVNSAVLSLAAPIACRIDPARIQMPPDSRRTADPSASVGSGVLFVAGCRYKRRQSSAGHRWCCRHGAATVRPEVRRMMTIAVEDAAARMSPL
jgi:hypothetical protein